MKSIGVWFDNLWNKHKFARRGLLFGVFFLIAYVTVYGVTDWTDSKFAALCALLGEASLLYQWDKKLQYDSENRNRNE